ncbi:MAG TPA: hypothetical protein VG994_15235 [Steroidobacteraceae bacterium]|nr:hypothetical protein [Steroidobacteraceae bacterium]
MTPNNDDSSREPARAHQPFSLPGIKSAVARRVSYEKPRRFITEGRETAEREGIEVDIETDAEFPIAGTGPALFVGDIAIVDSTRVGERRYRFFAPISLPLTKDAPLALGRAGSGVPKKEKRSKVRIAWRDQR